MSWIMMNTAPPAPAPVYDPAAEVDHWARQIAACTLIEDLAGLYGLSYYEVGRILASVDEREWWLLDSPQGWGLLAGFVSARLDLDGPEYQPQVH